VWWLGCGAVSLGVVWYTSGLGYVMSVMLEQQNSMVASVATCLVLGGFFNGIEPRFRTLSPFMKVVFGAPHRQIIANTAFVIGNGDHLLFHSLAFPAAGEQASGMPCTHPLEHHDVVGA